MTKLKTLFLSAALLPLIGFAQDSILNPVSNAVKKTTEVFDDTTINPDAETVTDRSPIKANPAAEVLDEAEETTKQVIETSKTINPDAEKVTDRSPVLANEESEAVTSEPVKQLTDRIPGQRVTREDLEKRMIDLRNKAEVPREVAPRIPVDSIERKPIRQLEENARKLVEGQPAPDEKVVEERARTIETEEDAQSLVTSILGVATNTSSEKVVRRLDESETGRTEKARQDTVTSLVNQFLGTGTAVASPNNARVEARAAISPQLQLHKGNRRVVRYANRSAIPPILLATGRLNRVDVRPIARADYIEKRPEWVQNVPANYQAPGAYAVSYQVDPQSVVTRDDILFRQGSTAFADAYSFDIVADLAEAMLNSRLRSEEFVIEGHASAEGSYELNLDLSQRRAERIARDLVGYGVNPNRLIPVGYGETEARYPADAREDLRRLDRRVMVFRLE